MELPQSPIMPATRRLPCGQVFLLCVPSLLQPIGRLSGTAYTGVTNLFDMQRPAFTSRPRPSDPDEPG